MSPSPSPSSSSQIRQRHEQEGEGEDMYRTILREIGYGNGGSMDYLFDDDSSGHGGSQNGHDDDDKNFSLLDSSSSDNDNDDINLNETINTHKKNNSNSHNNHSNVADLSQIIQDTSNEDDDDGSLLYRWEEEDNNRHQLQQTISTESLPMTKVPTPDNIHDHDHDGRIHSPSVTNTTPLKERLDETYIQQQQLYEQLEHLQQTQKKKQKQSASSFLSHHHQQQQQQQQPQVQTVPSTTSSVENHDPVSSSTPQSSSSSSVIFQQVSERNVQLEQQWTTQKVETENLQDKLTTLQLQFKNEQRQWKEDQSLLFSPNSRQQSRHPTTTAIGSGSKPNSSSDMTSPATTTKSAIPRSSSNAKQKSTTITTTDIAANTTNAGGGKSPANRNVYRSSLPGIPSPSASTSNSTPTKWKPKITTPRTLSSSKTATKSTTSTRRSSHNNQFWSIGDTITKNNDIGKVNPSVNKPSSVSSPTTPVVVAAAATTATVSTPSVHDSHLGGDVDELLRMKQLVEEYKAQLQQKEMEMGQLQATYESETKGWEAKVEDLVSDHNRVKDSLAHELESSRERLQNQVTLNQDLREEIHRLKSNNSGWKDELEAARVQIEDAAALQSQTTREFEAQIKELQTKHEDERQQWSDQLHQHQQKLTEKTAVLEEELRIEKNRYTELQGKHDREIKEWQALLEKEMAVDDPGSSSGGGGDSQVYSASSSALVGRNATELNISNRSNNESLEYSSVQDKSDDVSESMDRIDGLLEELGRMDAERAAVLDEMNNVSIGQTNGADPSKTPSTSSETHNRREIDHQAENVSDIPPMPVDSPPGSVMVDDGHHPDGDDSTALDQTLSLLHNLKDLIQSNGDGAEEETSVLEKLEVLSDLMQDDKRRSSIILSPGRNLSAMSDDFSLRNDNEDEKNNSLSSSFKLTPDVTDPWPALVQELKSRIAFLEHDRDELARITELVMQKERDSHRVKLEAAVATAKREVEEKLHKCQLDAHHTIRGIYRGLCHQCQSAVYKSMS